MKTTKPVFSLYETTKPKFVPNQIQIEANTRNPNMGLPKHSHKLIVTKSGKIMYSEN